MNDALFIALQRIAPQQLISRAAGALANSQTPFIKDLFIQKFAKRYDVDMSEAVEESLSAYPTFNAFFTRALKPGARTLCDAKDSILCPADGAISQIGAIDSGRIFQAKGQSFTTEELLASESLAEPYEHGQFATVYLSPKDYHRVHMPLEGTLTHMTYIPGQLFSVNQATADNVPRLFARNERVACHFDTPAGPMAVVLVGAMIVASIETPWAGLVAPVKRAIKTHHYPSSQPPQPPIHIDKGQEMGRFLLGSTAIVLLPANCTLGNDQTFAGAPVKMGQAIGKIEH